jgi:alpha-ribazole phosphatase
MEVFFVRHGRTEANAKGLYAGGGTDVPVSEEGFKEAIDTAKSDWFAAPFTAAFAKYGKIFGKDAPSLVYTSPMIRARQTAQVLFANAPHEVVEDFREFKFGSFEGRVYESLKSDPAYKAWAAGGNDSQCPGGGDSVNSCAGRVSRAFTNIVRARADAGDESPIVIVAHGGVAMAFLFSYINSAKPFFSWETPNCGVWHFDCAFDGKAASLTVLEAPRHSDVDNRAIYGIHYE